MTAIKSRALAAEWDAAQDRNDVHASRAAYLMGNLMSLAADDGAAVDCNDRAAQLEMEIYRYLRDSAGEG